jgi:replicative DNA helicase
VAGEIVDEAYKATNDVVGLIDDAERRINQIADDRAVDSVSPLHTLLLNEADILESRGETRGQLNGLETGYRALDQILQGLQPSSMTIIGARPGTSATPTGTAPTRPSGSCSRPRSSSTTTRASP